MSTLNGLLNRSLKWKLIELIRLRGSLSVADYMKIVLTNPESGFYMNKDVFGVKGHFTTSPEISQIFGEVLGAWILQEWKRFDSPKPLKLVEFGPGRGTLIADISRTIGILNKDWKNLDVNLIEISPHLKQVQQEHLKLHCPILRDQIKWLGNIEEVEDNREGFTAFIAHEFFDALPIHKFVRDPKTKQWRELIIDYDKDENLRFCISNQPSLATKLLIPKDFDEDHIEVCPEAALIAEKVTKKLNSSGKGCLLICDYGLGEKWPVVPDMSSTKIPRLSRRDTFRAFKNHESWPPLKSPGEADLTADVDFQYIKNHIEKNATIFGPVTQRNFLVQCGLHARLESLLNAAKSKEVEDELASGADMLLNDMGHRYKFMAVFPDNTKHLFQDDPPAGFRLD